MAIVKLSKPVPGPGGMIAAIEFREPTFEDLIALGEPETPMFVNGAMMFQQHMPVVGDYARRLCVQDPNLLTNLPLRDALKVRAAIIGFFREAEKDGTTSSADTQTTLSSSSSGTPAASGA